MLATRHDEIAIGILLTIVEADVNTTPGLAIEERVSMTDAELAAAYRRELEASGADGKKRAARVRAKAGR